MRLDLYVSNKFLISRNKAQELIKKGVIVNKKYIKKPSFNINEKDELVIDKHPLHVSRAAEKLEGFLDDELSLNVQGKTCLDIGSSTGGFVQILLKYGANEVIAVDVGSNQLHTSLKKNSKVIAHEKTDIRKFCSSIKYDIVTCDVSFISLQEIINTINKYAKELIIILFKPQFEVGKKIKRSKKGVVKDTNAILKAHTSFENIVKKYNWILIKKEESLVPGKEGNLETFYAFKKR